MQKHITLRQFQKQFPTEEACLDHLMRNRYGERHDCGKCGRNAHFYRITTRKVYACEYCGHHVSPMAGTPFARTRTPLQDWFYVMFLFTTTRNGVAAKEVERQIGVTYKTAWRMCHEIRKYMGQIDGDDTLGGEWQSVEVDETYLGGYERGGQGGKGKTTVLGMMDENEVITRVVPNVKRATLIPHIKDNVKEGSLVNTDELKSYATLADEGFRHITVNHGAGQYVGKMGATVNALEGFWAQLKRSINGTHIHVSSKHLSKYLGEFEFRHNRRNAPALMLHELMTSFAR